MKATWLTDIHLNFLSLPGRVRFYEELRKESSEAIFITGDIAEAPSVNDILGELQVNTGLPIYFVAGNHDYYHGSIDGTRRYFYKLEINLPIKWLNIECLPIDLGDDIYIAGVDGWADGQNGDFELSSVELNDSRLIKELHDARKNGRVALGQEMLKWAYSDTCHLSNKIKHLPELEAKKCIILTHIPPFPETALYAGKISGSDFLPFFTNKTMGDMLLEFATENPNIELSVLCGHSHSKAHYQPLPNLSVRCGAAEYLCPEIQITCDISEL